jgi:hypothetical protein
MYFPPPALALIRATLARTAGIVGIAQKRVENAVFANDSVNLLSDSKKGAS